MFQPTEKAFLLLADKAADTYNRDRVNRGLQPMSEIVTAAFRLGYIQAWVDRITTEASKNAT